METLVTVSKNAHRVALRDSTITPADLFNESLEQEK